MDVRFVVVRDDHVHAIAAHQALRLADEGIHLQSSTSLLEPMLARAGVLTL